MVWLKAWHVIFMVTWFAGLFYLPRLFVYHAEATDDPVGRERFKVMERRLFVMTTIGGVLTTGFGLAMYAIGHAYFVTAAWLHVKLGLVALLIAYHAYTWKLIKELKEDRSTRSSKWYRMYNELPTLLLIGIVLLAIGKPF